MSDFPVLDAPRPIANAEHARVILDAFGDAEPFIEEIDGWLSMPLRLVHDQANGFHIELGIYSLDASDIWALRRAIEAYDKAVGRTPAGGNA